MGRLPLEAGNCWRRGSKGGIRPVVALSHDLAVLDIYAQVIGVLGATHKLSLPIIASMKLIKRSWFRYSLRTFLVILTLFAVWLGVQVHRARQTRLAIDAIEELRGQINYVHERITSGGFGFDSSAKLPGPAWLRELIGNEYFLDVSIIQL